MSTIQGNVTDGSGTGISSATVTVTESGSGAFEAEATTDENGDYSLAVDPDTYDVRAEKPDYDPTERTGITVGSDETVTVDLSTSHVDYKTRGQIHDVRGIGVLGRNTAITGTPKGVVGKTPVATGSGYGVKGATVSDQGAGVLGTSTATSGEPVGVLGRVPDGSSGFGLATPDDARIEGTIDTGGTDFRVRTGTTGTNTNVVLGHASNNAISGVVGSVISGGGLYTQGAAFPNTVEEDHATICGGFSNTASGQGATVGGGRNNYATDSQATVGGGIDNKAHGKHSTIGGGVINRTGKSGTSTGVGATVPGGEGNLAREAYSFAAGRSAHAHHRGAFVWADSTSTDVTSGGTDQFIVAASGGAGFGTETPATQLHVRDAVAGGAAGAPGNHVVLIDNAADDTGGVDASNANGLAIQAGPIGAPPKEVNYVSFYDGDGDSRGAIEGNGSGGVRYKNTGSDFAEYLPKADPDRDFAAGEVVGVRAGELVADAAGADRAMVVSDQQIVLGNDPGGDAAGHEPVAFTGQVPVRVRGTVDAGDLVVPAGHADGTARAIAPAAWTPGDEPLVGQAWEPDDAEGVSEVTVAVGVDDPGVVGESVAALRAENERLHDAVAAHRDRIDTLEASNADLRERVAALERRLEPTETARPSADD